MAILTKYKSFEELKSNGNLCIEKPLDAKAVMEEFQAFISMLRRSKKNLNRSNNHTNSNEQQSTS